MKLLSSSNSCIKMASTWANIVKSPAKNKSESCPQPTATPKRVEKDDDTEATTRVNVEPRWSGKGCPQCEDNAWFLRVGIHAHRDKIHEEAVKEANETAKTWADSDNVAGSLSLSWQDLWLCHFSKAYNAAIQRKNKELNDEYQMACYKKPYGKRESDICCYHMEFRC